METKEQIVGQDSVKEKIKIKEPNLYNVIMYNDDFTPMDFVVNILEKIFNKDEIEAERIMYEVHEKGRGLAGIYPYDIAKTKMDYAMSLAEKHGFPFKLTIENK